MCFVEGQALLELLLEESAPTQRKDEIWLRQYYICGRTYGDDERTHGKERQHTGVLCGSLSA